jgi:hypothetical protein
VSDFIKKHWYHWTCTLPDTGADHGTGTSFSKAFPEPSTLTRRISSPRAAGLYPGVHVLLESSFNIAWEYLQRTDALEDDAARFLTDEIERPIRKGHRNRMFLANIAIIKYREFRREVA